jgi:hypothetical protein
MYALSGTVIGGLIVSGTAMLQERWARRRDAEALASMRADGRADFHRTALVALHDSIPGLLHRVALVDEEEGASLQELHLVTWQFNALRHKVDDLRVREAAAYLADAIAEVVNGGASPMRIQTVVDRANDLLAVIGNVLTA